MDPISEILQQQEFPQLDFVSTRFLVIGGNGYFGSKLVAALVGKGAQHVRVFDRVQTRFHGNQEVEFHVGDLCDPASVAKATSGIDVIYHTASCFGNPPFGSFGEGKLEWQVNVEGTRNVIRAARQEAQPEIQKAEIQQKETQQKQTQAHQRKKFVRLVYIGSSSAVFNGERDFIDEPEESGYPEYFVDHYGRTKAIAEQEVCAANSPEKGLLTCVLRPNGIYGEDEMMHLPRARKLCRLSFDCLPVDWASECDWTFIDNLSFACLLAVEKMGPNSIVNGNLYNITDGEATTMQGFFGPALRATGVQVFHFFTMPAFLFYLCAYIMELFCYLTLAFLRLHSPFTRIEAIKIARSASFSIEKAKKHLGYVPIVSMEEGIRRTAEDFKKRYEAAQQKLKTA